jgi:hypothetical protein
LEEYSTYFVLLCNIHAFCRKALIARKSLNICGIAGMVRRVMREQRLGE